MNEQQRLLRNMKGKYFHFTIPNWMDEDIPGILPTKPKLEYLIMGKEIAPTTGMPQL